MTDIFLLGSATKKTTHMVKVNGIGDLQFRGVVFGVWASACGAHEHPSINVANT